MNYLRRYPLTICCIGLIWYLCLVRVPADRIPSFSGADKVAHVLMYLGTCGICWAEYFRSHRRFALRRTLVFAVILPIVMSGIIELAQAYLTTCRSGDWLDFLANSCGVLTAFGAAMVYRRYFFRKS